jgi:hypothetical protein
MQQTRALPVVYFRHDRLNWGQPRYVLAKDEGKALVIIHGLAAFFVYLDNGRPLGHAATVPAPCIPLVEKVPEPPCRVPLSVHPIGLLSGRVKPNNVGTVATIYRLSS